jgi:hypothetical protein
MKDRETDSHDSYGMVGFSRVSSSHGQNFFGSSIRSSHYIELTIRRAERVRDLSTYWYHGREELISVRLSPNQFAELLTTMNVGYGTPCTLQHVNRVQQPDCPSVDQRTKFEQEFAQDVEDTMSDAASLVDDIKDVLINRPSLGKRDRAEIAKALDQLLRHITGGMPFIQSQFNEALDRTVTEAKGEVEAFVNNKIPFPGHRGTQQRGYASHGRSGP